MSRKNNGLIEYSRKEYYKQSEKEMHSYRIDNEGILSAPLSQGRIFVSNAIQDKNIQGYEWRECRSKKPPELMKANK